MVSPVLVLALVVVVYFYFVRNWRFYWAAAKFGGPFGVPVLGLAYEMSNQKKLVATLGKYFENYGSPVAGWLGHHFLVICSDAASVKAVLTSPACINKADPFVAIKPAVGNGLLLARDGKWHDRRKLLQPTLGVGILQSCFNIYNEVSDDLIVAIENKVVAKGALVREELSKAVLEVACQTTMGRKMNFLSSERNKFLDDFYQGTNLAVRKMVCPWLQIPGVYDRTKHGKMEKGIIKTMRGFANSIIQEKQKKYGMPTPLVDAAADEEKHKRIFLDEVFHLLENKTLSLDDLIDETNNMLVTAADTLNSLTYMTVVCMAIHTQCQDRLRQEIRDHLPHSKDLTITVKDLNDMKYLDRVIHETLRLFPSVPLIFRAASKDVDISDELRIPKDTQILISFYHLHRDPKIWGPNANEFNPDNFLPEHFAKINPYGFAPYAKGIRTCMGAKYSQIVAKMFLVKIINRYRISTSVTMSDLTATCAISLKLTNDVPIQFEDLYESC